VSSSRRDSCEISNYVGKAFLTISRGRLANQQSCLRPQQTTITRLAERRPNFGTSLAERAAPWSPPRRTIRQTTPRRRPTLGAAWLLALAIPFLFLLFASVGPLVDQAVGSFFNWYDVHPVSFAGFHYYGEVLADPTATAAIVSGCKLLMFLPICFSWSHELLCNVEPDMRLFKTVSRGLVASGQGQMCADFRSEVGSPWRHSTARR
jgi:hypothetical protein